MKMIVAMKITLKYFLYKPAREVHIFYNALSQMPRSAPEKQGPINIL